MTIRRSFELLSGSYLVLTIALGVVAGFLFLSQRNLERSQRLRFQSYLLAEELQQNSEDLTRLARAYVATGDDRRERYYLNALAIRNGEKPRPVSDYWAYGVVAEVERRVLRPGLEMVTTQQLMAMLELTPLELSLLRQAQGNDDSLVRIQRGAISARKGLYDDGTGRFTMPGRPDQALATRLLHGEAYQRLQTEMLRPIDQFLTLLDGRITSDMLRHERLSYLCLVLAGGLVAALLALTLQSVGTFRRRVYAPVEALQKQTYAVAADLDRLADTAKAIADGDLSRYFSPETTRLGVAGEDELSRLARLQDAMIVCLEQTGSAIARVTAELGTHAAALETANRELEAKGAILAREIEERKRTEAELHRSKLKLEMLFAQLPAIMWTTDRELRFTSSTGRELDALDLAPGQVVGLSLFEYFRTDDPDFQPLAAHRRAIEGETVDYSMEWSGRSYATRVTPLRDIAGAISGTVGIARDVTEQRKAEAALEASEARYRELVENQGEGVGIVDSDERFMFINPAGEAIFGFRPGELVGRSLRDLLEPDQIALVAKQSELRSRGERTVYDLDIRRPDGSGRSIQVTATPRLGADGSWTGTFGVFRDVTERRQAEAALQESEEKYRDLVERATDGVIIIQDTVVRFTNGSFAEMLGRSVSDIVGSVFFDHVHPSERARVAGIYEQRMAGTPVPPSYETTLRRKDGSLLPVELNGGLVSYRGKPADLKVVRDITERRRMTEALQSRNRELAELNAQKNQFLGMAAHDLRNPLAVLLGFSDFLLAESGGRLNPEQRQVLAEVKRRSEFMLRLVEDLLDVSKIESGQVQLELAPTDLAALTERNVGLNRLLAERKGVHVTLVRRDEIPVMLLDGPKIEQVLNNLIGNAVKFSQPGTTTTVELAAVDDMVTIAVRDQGAGIPADELCRLFEPFSRGSVKATDGERGTGLGLLIAKRIVESHSGTTQVESAVGKGSTFTVTLPVP